MSPAPNETLTRSSTRLAAFAMATFVAVGLAACSPPGPDPEDQEVAPTSESASAEDAGEPAASTSPPDAEHETPGGVTGEHPRDRDDEEPEAGTEGPEPAGTDEEPAEMATPLPLSGRLIALDPGHNGGNFDARDEIAREVDAGPQTKPCNTVGAVSEDGYRESTFNIELAERLRAILEARGAEVILTREGDDGVGPCIDERGTFGQDMGTDLMISIHADGAPEDAHGFHVIRPGGWEGQSADIVERSSDLATLVRDRLVEYGLTPATYAGSDGIDVRSDLGTLNLAEVPAVLLEAGNMHNDEDLALLRSADGQDRIGAALADAIEDYLGG
jgi:N-acetylmuramoyl-L-alanine amidase